LLQLGNTAQAELIAAHAEERSRGSLTVGETRAFDRGVVVQITR
jgi:release factor glutamine methyltransferase/ribosomal protein L3 glutamine methyltransferase